MPSDSRTQFQQDMDAARAKSGSVATTTRLQGALIDRAGGLPRIAGYFLDDPAEAQARAQDLHALDTVRRDQPFLTQWFAAHPNAQALAQKDPLGFARTYAANAPATSPNAVPLEMPPTMPVARPVVPVAQAQASPQSSAPAPVDAREDVASFLHNVFTNKRGVSVAQAQSLQGVIPSATTRVPRAGDVAAAKYMALGEMSYANDMAHADDLEKQGDKKAADALRGEAVKGRIELYKGLAMPNQLNNALAQMMQNAQEGQ